MAGSDVDADQTRLAKAGETVPPATAASIPNVGGVPVLQTGQTFAHSARVMLRRVFFSLEPFDALLRDPSYLSYLSGDTLGADSSTIW
jgi:hypothetical protein